MKKIILFLLFSPFILYGQNQLSWDAIHDQPPSSWVKEVNFSKEVDPETIWRNGGKILLYDSQYNHTLREQYVHFASALHSRATVDAWSTIEIPFNPNVDEIIIHQIRIFRDGQWLDRLSNSHRMISLKNRHSKDLIYSSEQTLLIALDDIQKGDILEYSYTRKKLDIWSDRSLNWWFDSTLSTSPQRLYRRLVAETDEPVAIKAPEAFPAPWIQEIGSGCSEWVWDMEDVDPAEQESHLPSWYRSPPIVQISNVADWEEIARTKSLFYAISEPLSEEIQELVSEWLQNYSLEDAVLQAIRFVQTEIRYLSWHLGEEPYIPFHPNEVFKKRFGDCKDKVLLLIGMLQLMEIEAFPILVDSNDRHQIAEFLPTGNFNHVIAGFELDGHKYFVETTFDKQGGGLNQLELSSFGYGVVVKESGGELISLPVVSGNCLVEQKLEFHIQVSQNLANLHLEKSYYRRAADNIRGYLQDRTLIGWCEAQEERYSRDFPKIIFNNPPEVSDQFHKNEITISLDCILEKVLTEDSEHLKFEFNPFFVGRLLPTYLKNERKSPYRLEFPENVQETIVFNFDCDFDEELEDKRLSYEGCCIAFEFELLRTGERQFTIYTSYQTFKDAIMVDELEEVMEQLKLFKEELHFSVNLASPSCP